MCVRRGLQAAGCHTSAWQADIGTMQARLRRVCHRGSISALGVFFLPFPNCACFCPPSPNNLEYHLAVSKNLAHPLHPVYDDGKGGGWKWWE